MIILIQNNEIKNRTTLDKIVSVIGHDLLKIIALILGFLVTYAVIYSINGDKTLIIIFKGISIQVLLNTFLSLNISEMILWFYFFILFIVILSINYIVHKYYTNKEENLTIKLFMEFIKIFSEGSLVLPLFLMIGLPFIVQTVLPTIIYGVLLIEMLVPVIITGKIFKKSTDNFRKLVNERMIDIKSIKLVVISLMYPFFIFLMIWSNLDVFYSLVHYNLLWDNPSSSIAVGLWNILDQIVTTLEFGNSGLHDIIYHFILYLNSLIILAILSIIYLFFEDKMIRTIKYVISEKLMPYN